MTFADPRVCLSCRGAIDAGTATCPHCGMDLSSAEIQNAWQALVVADQWIERARGVMAGGAAASASTPAAAPAAQVPAVPARRRLSAGTVLLVLGAVSLLVAGLIFITVSWGSLGILGRALALLAFTAVVGALAQVLTRRALRASAESLWTVFLGLLTLDWFAARDQGLFGLDALPGGHTAGVWGLVLLGAGLGIVRTGREPLRTTLVAPALAAGVAPVIGAGGVAAELINDDPFWWALLAGAVAGAVTLLHHRLRIKPAKVVAGIGTGILAVVAVVAALIEATDHPSIGDLVSDGHGLPLLVVATVAALVGYGTRDWVRSAATTVGALSITLLLVLPVDDAWHLRGGFVVAAVASIALAVLGGRGDGAWSRGFRCAAGLAAVCAAVAAAPWVGRLIEVCASGASGERARSLAEDIELGPHVYVGPWWVPMIVALGFAGVLLLSRRWPECADKPQVAAHLRGAGAAALALGAATSVSTTIPPAASLGTSLVVIGGLLILANRSAPLVWRHLGSGVVTVAPLVTLTSWPASLVVWPLAAAVLLLSGWRESDLGVRWAERGFAAWWVSLVPGVAMAHLGRPVMDAALATIATAAVVLVATVLRDRTRTIGAGDLGAAAAGVIGLILGALPPGLNALPWTVAGVGVTAAGLVNRNRRWCHWAGPVLLGIAYVVRLAQSDIDVIEAYTAPFAVALLCLGLWTMRKSDVRTLRALGPGVALTLLPSLPQALDEPTSLRALLLGVLSVALIAVGLSRKWQALFVGGVVVALLLVVANIGPWALGLPRWVLIASLGALAIGVGATWESRVRNGKAVASYVSGMR